MIFSVSSRTSVVRHLLPVAAVLILSSSQVLAAGITIGANSSISVGAGMINVGCGDLTNNGLLSEWNDFVTLNQLRHPSRGHGEVIAVRAIGSSKGLSLSIGFRLPRDYRDEHCMWGWRFGFSPV